MSDEKSEEGLRLAARLGKPSAAKALGEELRDPGEEYLQQSDFFYESEDPYAESQAKIAEFGVELDRLQALAETVLGPPDESHHGLSGEDPSAEPGSFAESMYWRGVVRLAAWNVAPGRVGFLAVEHQDKEVPVVLILGLQEWPPAEE